MISAVHPSRPRAIILDLDRTLLHTDKSLSTRAIRALLACRAKGIQIMMATARPYRCTLDDCEKIPFDAMTVTNGAIILCEDQRLDFPMSPQSAQAMLALAGLIPAQAIYFGDDQDDIAPLRHCGIGVAMENAIADAKAAADYITKSNDEDGVAVFLESFFQV
ncbi:MAG: HAD hydrolase family protein [Clostridiales bacterium]|nr:HAD hydrolase family protein [Clostridiales bacterium]